ncbi:MAG: hypothetical protein ACXVEU_01920 [Nocardioidaceae bacterium]
MTRLSGKPNVDLDRGRGHPQPRGTNMSLTSWTGQIARSMDDGTERSDAEIAFFQGVALVVATLIRLLRVADTVYEAWPLPNSRARK